MLKHLIGIGALSLALSLTATAEEQPQGILLPAAQASYTVGKGLAADNTKQETYYDETDGLIKNLAQDGEVVYTVPEETEGTFDLYLTVSKMMVQFTSQPFSFLIGEGEVYSIPVDCEVSADAAQAYTQDGEEYNTGTLYDKGRFLIAQDVSLTGGETIKVLATFGGKGPSLKSVTYPAVGEVELFPAGTVVPTGYDQTVKEIPEADPADPLSGLHILWVGSSVTYGAHAGGHYSMVNAIQDNHPGTVCEKYAISATTLVNDSASSYVNRLTLIPKDKTPDLIVVQLSTNDAGTGKPFGEIAEGTSLEDFDQHTIAGAIEYIIAYARDVFHCPVAFYTGSYCEKENYKEMVELLLEIQKKWDIGVFDMFNNQEMTDLFQTDLWNEYMFDEVHPTRKGYVEWWTPFLEEKMAEYMESLD